MFCKNCGKEIKDGSAFCSECGTSIEPTTAEIPNINNENTVAAEQPKNKYPTKLVILAIIAAIVIIVIAINVDEAVDEKISNDKYINAAKNIVSQELKSPSTAIYYNEEIVEQDDYGRTIVKFDVESQNTFGGYVKSTCYVVLLKYDEEKESFMYNAATGVFFDNSGFDSDSVVKELKGFNHWNEEFEDSESD